MKFVVYRKDVKAEFVEAVDEIRNDHQTDLLVKIIESDLRNIITTENAGQVNNLMVVFGAILSGYKEDKKWESLDETWSTIVKCLGEEDITKENKKDYLELCSIMRNEWDMDKFEAHLIEYIKNIDFEYVPPSGSYNTLTTSLDKV